MLCLSLVMFSFISPAQVSVTATIACNRIALAEQHDGGPVRKSILGQQFVTMKIAKAQCVHWTVSNWSLIPDISYTWDLLTLIDKFNLFRIADNYAIEQLILHNHLTKADCLLLLRQGKWQWLLLNSVCPLRTVEGWQSSKTSNSFIQMSHFNSSSLWSEE